MKEIIDWRCYEEGDAARVREQFGGTTVPDKYSDNYPQRHLIARSTPVTHGVLALHYGYDNVAGTSIKVGSPKFLIAERTISGELFDWMYGQATAEAAAERQTTDGTVHPEKFAQAIAGIFKRHFVYDNGRVENNLRISMDIGAYVGDLLAVRSRKIPYQCGVAAVTAAMLFEQAVEKGDVPEGTVRIDCNLRTVQDDSSRVMSREGHAWTRYTPGTESAPVSVHDVQLVDQTHGGSLAKFLADTPSSPLNPLGYYIPPELAPRLDIQADDAQVHSTYFSLA